MTKVIDLTSRRRAREGFDYRGVIDVAATLPKAQIAVCEREGRRWFHLRGIDGSLHHDELVQLYEAVRQALRIAKERDRIQRPGRQCPKCGLRFKGQGFTNHVRSHE